MPKTPATEPSRNTTLNPALLALTPRQALISRPVMAKESKALSLKSEQKALLLRSIARYLERSGFSKCFKKLLSEAEIEKKELDSALPDLEEVYGVFLNKSNLEAVEVKDESGQVDENASDDQKKEAADVEGVEKVKKEKKKKKKVEVTKDDKVKETDTEIEDEVKEKKKKKKKEPKVEEKVKETDTELEDGVKEKKKKKKNKSKATEAETLGDDEEKVSKKRKRSEPEEETKEQREDDEDSKRRKKEEKVAEEDMDVQETPAKQTDVQENGNVEKSETKSTDKKSGKGLSSSKEPKKPFQRVNVEEVVFTDDRLKDNSYWAKGGADSGYGAKAQEVLGQVRGRGFRHEKTKKKRGSYRGGEIDLQSHSVKFEYSDDE